MKLSGQIIAQHAGWQVAAHMKRFAAKRKSNTDPDVTTTAVMLSALRMAVETTTGKRLAAGAACFARPFWDFDRFLVAM